MTRILGIDPGSRITGYGVIDMDGNRAIYVDCGHIQVTGDSLASRLKLIFDGIQNIINSHSPDEISVEKVFMGKNVDSALKLGQARGAAICAASQPQVPVVEYSPTQIKQAIVGRGRADKTQIQHMVRILLNLQGKLQVDAADALAIALCHGHTRQTMNKIELSAARMESSLKNALNKKKYKIPGVNPVRS